MSSKARKVTATPTDLRRMFAAGDTFREASFNYFKTIPMPHVLRFLPPHAVLAALSLEIYFKCLILLDKKSYGTTHDLLELFGKLEERTKDRIAELYLPHMERAQVIVDQHHRNVLSRSDEPPVANVEYVLNSCRRAFENFRYHYEPGKFQNGEGWSGDALVECTRLVILERHPEWADLTDLQPVFVERTGPL